MQQLICSRVVCALGVKNENTATAVRQRTQGEGEKQRSRRLRNDVYIDV